MLLGFVLDLLVRLSSVDHQVGIIYEDIFIALMANCTGGIAKIESHSLFIHGIEEHFVYEIPRSGGATAPLSSTEMFVFIR